MPRDRDREDVSSLGAWGRSPHSGRSPDVAKCSGDLAQLCLKAEGAENQLAVELGCAVDELGHVHVDATKRTTVPDVRAIGDVTNLRSNMSIAIADGVLAAVDCNTALLDRDWNETA